MPRSSNLRASSLSGNPYGRTNDVIEAASIGPKATLVPDSCPECGTTLREGGKLNGLSRINKFCALGKGNMMSRWRGRFIFKTRIQGRFSIISWMDHATRSMIMVSSVNVAVWSLSSTSLSTGQTPPSSAIVPLDPWALSLLSSSPSFTLAVDLLSAECDGLWIKTPRYPNGKCQDWNHLP
ncbi:hypothetical protein C360_05801 [Cryptococcus neoformans Bt15]|nr:hypothetical protein C360_05801 [Cryptococcus neoformans var. grubii Bt15]